MSYIYGGGPPSVTRRTRTRSGKAGLSVDEEVTRLDTELAASRRASEEKDEELRGLRSALQEAKSDAEEAGARTQSRIAKELERQLENERLRSGLVVLRAV